MSLSNYLRKCTKTVAGNYDKVYLAKIGDIDGLTFDADEVNGITMETGKHFVEVQADLDSVQFTAEDEATRGFFSNQELIMVFSQKSKELVALKDEISDAVTCGLVAIRIDGNNKGWLSGIAPVAKMVSNRPYLRMSANFDSGQSIEDVDEGNRYTITLGRLSATGEYPLTSSVTESILNGTAAFIDFPNGE